jgi:hypothetical protein
VTEASYGIGIVARAELASLDNCTSQATAAAGVGDGDNCNGVYHGTTLTYGLAAFLIAQGRVFWHPTGPPAFFPAALLFSRR